MKSVQLSGFLTVLILLCGSSISQGEEKEVFKRYQLFPGPNLSGEDYFEDIPLLRRPSESFQIGKIGFAYFDADSEKEDREVEKSAPLSEVISVQQAVEESQPEKWLEALVNQQFESPHRFKFEKAALTGLGDEGYEWTVRRALYPKIGGSSGMPSRHHAKVSANGNLISPHMYLVEEFSCLEPRGWMVCRLELKKRTGKIALILEKEQIRQKALRSWEKFKLSHKKEIGLKPNDLQFIEMKKVRIPVSQTKQEKLIYEDVWAVKLMNTTEQKQEKPAVPFYIWVRPSGEVGDLFYIDAPY